MFYSTFSIFILSVIVLLLTVWLAHFSTRSAAPRFEDRDASRLVLLGFLLSRSLNFQIRTDLNALVTQGLTIQNRVQVIVTICACIWALYLVSRSRVSLNALFSSSGFWVSCSVIAFAVTTFWSVWPVLSLYRALELAAIWVICVHVFSHRDWYDQVHYFLWATLLMHLTNGLLSLGLHGPAQDNIVGLMRSNGGSALAAVLVIWSMHYSQSNGWFRNWWMMPVAAGSLIVFGSITSSVALLAGSVIYFFYSAPKSIKPIIVAGFTALALTFMSYAFLKTGDLSGAANSGIQGIATMFDRSPEGLRSATGRAQLWAAMWEASKENPLGFGFAAAERVFSADKALVGWAPGPGGAHNGFLSGLFGSGWLGVSLVFLVFLSIWPRIKTADVRLVPLALAILFIIAFNNLSLPIFGGAIAPVSIVILAIALIPTHTLPTIDGGLDDTRANSVSP